MDLGLINFTESNVSGYSTWVGRNVHDPSMLVWIASLRVDLSLVRSMEESSGNGEASKKSKSSKERKINPQLRDQKKGYVHWRPPPASRRIGRTRSTARGAAQRSGYLRDLTAVAHN